MVKALMILDLSVEPLTIHVKNYTSLPFILLSNYAYFTIICYSVNLERNTSASSMITDNVISNNNIKLGYFS